MNFLNKLEDKVYGWFKAAPGLPTDVRKWLGENAWWIVIIALIFTAINILRSLAYLEAKISLQGTAAASYIVSSNVSDWTIVTAIVASLVFLAAEAILLFLAVQPLREKQKKGWVLLFASWLVSGVALVVNALLTLDVFSFIITVLFGAIWLAVGGYFLFEIHGQFVRVVRSPGVKKAK